jgi:ribosomal protein S18 acetylase RimI-like enzyme
VRFFRPVPRVSLAGRGDVAALSELLEVEPEEVEAWLEGGFELYKATLDGELVGSIRCAFPTGACVIDRLTVRDQHRRRGFGQYLAEHAVSRARRAGAGKVWTQVPATSGEPLRMLDRLGFRPAGQVTASGSQLLLLELPL